MGHLSFCLFVFLGVLGCKYYTISWEHGLGFEYSILRISRYRKYYSRIVEKVSILGICMILYLYGSVDGVAIYFYGWYAMGCYRLSYTYL